MTNPKISVQAACAILLWFAGFGFVLASFFTEADDLPHLGLALCCGGAVCLFRVMLCQQAAVLKNAFDLGRDTGRLEASLDERPRTVPFQRV